MNKPTTKKKIRRQFRLSSEPKELLMELFTMLIAFAITPISFFFSTMPFGLAFCASSKRRAPFAVAGSALGALIFMDNYIPYIIALLALVGLRLAGSVWLHDNGEKEISLGKRSRPSFVSLLFTERASVRVALCALCSFGLGVYRVIASSYSYYEIFVLIFSTVFVSILTYALCSLYEENTRGQALGVCALLFIFIYAIRGKEVFGLDISMVLSYAVTLYASKYISGTKSTALGALLGLCHGVLFAPVFAICALVSSFLWSFSYYFAIISALVMSIGYGIFASGYEAIVYLLPELLLASLIMYPLTRFEIIPRPRFLLEEKRGENDMIIIDNSSRVIKERLGSVALSFKEISSMLSELSQRERSPDREFFRGACLEICESHCFTCPKRSICWERDSITTKDNIERLGEATFNQGILNADCVDERFLHRCPNIEKILDELTTLRKESIKNAGSAGKLDISAQDFELVSRLVEGMAQGIDTACVPSTALGDKAKRACDRLGFRCERIEVFGQDYYRIIATGVNTEASKCTLDELRRALEDSLGTALCEPRLEEINGISTLYLNSSRSLNASSVKNRLSRHEGEENGDTMCEFFTPEEKFYMLLCDGMGSGTDASLTSSICAEFMQKILSSCKDKELCMNMLNNLIRAKKPECSSSIDLLEIDLISGSSCLVKSGAAPSFIKRGENVFRLHSKTAPIGIMKNLDAERLDFSLRDGDIVVMVSDGIASDERDSRFLVDYLSKITIVDTAEGEVSEDEPPSLAKSEVLSPANAESTTKSAIDGDNDDGKGVKISLDALPNAILALAKERNALHRDDMSVGVIQISSAS